MKKFFTIFFTFLLLGFTINAQVLSISRLAVQLSAQANSTDTIRIFSNTNWTAVSNQAWLSISSNGGSGDSIIRLTATANLTPTNRSGQITISGSGVISQTVTVTQIHPPLLSVSKDSVVIAASAISTCWVKITSFSDWSASCNQPWLALQPSSFVNSLTYAGPYYATGVRIHPTSGNIFFNNLYEVLSMVDSVTITKPNAGDYPVYPVQIQLTKNSIVVGGKTMIMVNVAVDGEAGGTGMLETDQNGNPTNYFDPSTRTFNLSYFYNKTAPRKVYEVLVGITTSSTITMTATATENPDFSIRQATITIKASGVPDKIVKVTQEATPVLSVSTNSLLMAAANSTITFNINSLTNWTVAGNQDWLTISKTSGSNKDTIIVSATANPASSARTATITVIATGGTTQVINVTQYGIVSVSGKWKQFFIGHSYTELSVVNDSVFWLSGYPGNTISYTLNGGITWSTKNLPFGIPRNTGFCAVSATTAYIASGEGVEFGLFKTTDGADNWTLQPTGFSKNKPSSFFGASFPDFVYFWDIDNGLTYGDDNEIYTTNNGGAQWNRVSSTVLLSGIGEWSYAAQESYRVVGNTIYILVNDQGGHTRIIKSNDKGLNWSAIIPPTNSRSASFDFKDDNNGLYVDYSHKQGKLYSTIDGGQNWSIINSTDNLHTLKYITNQNLYVSTYAKNGLLYSTDNGQTWSANPSFNFNNVATYNCVISPMGKTAYISGNGYLYSSQNIAAVNTSVDQVTITGPNSLDLTFSNNVELISANDTANYVLTYSTGNSGKGTSNLMKRINTIVALRDNSNYSLVHLITQTALPLDTVNINVNNIYDMTGFPLINGSSSSAQTVILNFALSKTILDIGAQANSTNTFSITSNLSWEISSDQIWLSASSSSGSGNSLITLTAAENHTNVPRTAIVTVSVAGVSTQTILVTQDHGTTGVNKFKNSEISIFPNPTRNLLCINGLSQNSTVAIYDFKGKIVFSKQILGNEIDISNLAKGIYTLKIIDKSRIINTKLIKQ